uniref:Putative ovule protein n=1 Tax=Solanum chacoense TaxID=4108 RepID=A0A0V0GX04_SOLCH
MNLQPFSNLTKISTKLNHKRESMIIWHNPTSQHPIINLKNTHNTQNRLSSNKGVVKKRRTGKRETLVEHCPYDSWV